VREIARLEEDLDGRTATINELRQMRSDNETAKILEVCLKLDRYPAKNAIISLHPFNSLDNNPVRRPYVYGMWYSVLFYNTTDLCPPGYVL
jgi:hypothetical protein